MNNEAGIRDVKWEDNKAVIRDGRWGVRGARAVELPLFQGR